MLPLEGLRDGQDAAIRVLSRPYTTLRSLSSGSMPALSCAGAILVDQCGDALVGLAHLTAHIHRQPWLIPCLVMFPGQDPLEPLLFLVSELRNRLAVAHV